MPNLMRLGWRRVRRPFRAWRDKARGMTREPLTAAMIAELVDRPEPTLLEIGCNDGLDTLQFLAAMPRARVFCFEPDPRAIARFKANLGERLGQVELFEVAISDRSGMVTFHVSHGDAPDLPDGWDRSGSIRLPAQHLALHPWVKFPKSIEVPTCRLDDWAGEQGVDAVDFIWMDVQGAEGDVLAGAQGVLTKTRYLYTEYDDRELYQGQLPLAGILKLLPEFQILRRYSHDVLLRNVRLT